MWSSVENTAGSPLLRLVGNWLFSFYKLHNLPASPPAFMRVCQCPSRPKNPNTREYINDATESTEDCPLLGLCIAITLRFDPTCKVGSNLKVGNCSFRFSTFKAGPSDFPYAMWFR